MPQGGSKLQPKPATKRHNKANNPKKGQRTIAPKKQGLVRAAAQKKVFCSPHSENRAQQQR
jgi:hypothetical protein